MNVMLHIGLGSFHRAHQAVYLHRLRETGDRSWAIVGGNSRPDMAETMAALISQDGRYTLETVTPAGVRAYEIITAIERVIPYAPDLAGLIDVGADAATRIVSFTVTEAGYYLDPHDRLDLSAKDLAADLEAARSRDASRSGSTIYAKDWLRLGLTGEKVSEMSDASGTLWLDVGRRRWSADVLAACGLGIEHMPRLVEGSEVSAHLLPTLAARWGLKPGIPIAGGGGDNAASAVGIGAVRPGQGFVSLGTSGVIFLASEHFRPNPTSAMHAFCHALPNSWHQMSVMLSAASALRWVRELLGLPSEEALLERVAALTPAQQAAAPIFLPYLSGERTPHNDPQAQGVLFGLGGEHDAASVGYAVIEGVAFGLHDGWASMNAAPGEVTQLSLVGGGARSALWAKLIASALGVPLVTHEGGEAGGALGAARLAWLAAGGDLGSVCVSPPVRDHAEPDAQFAALLGPRYERFRRLYPVLRPHFGNRAIAESGNSNIRC